MVNEFRPAMVICSVFSHEGTSYHYLPPNKTAEIHKVLFNRISILFSDTELSLEAGKSWTTDAPYRETQQAIEIAKKHGVTAIEMEASALYAYVLAKEKNLICYTHNQFNGTE